MIMFKCAENDFEGETTSGAIRHCEMTGHVLTREDVDAGTVTTISLDTDDDEAELDYFDPGDDEEED